MPHPASDGDMRAASLSLVRDKVFDGHFRAIFQPGGKIGETAVQFLGFLCVRFFPTAASVHVIREQTTEA